MMKYRYTLVYLLIILLPLCLFAQDKEQRGMLENEYKSIQKLEIKNLDKDTYLKFEDGFILDRENLPYTFKFSDGLLRKMYLYKVFSTGDMKQIGQLAVFSISSSPETFKIPIPSSECAVEVWSLYLDDIKHFEEKIQSFSTCLAFVLTREQKSLGNSGKEDAKTAEESYEYCFPATAKITLADGSEKYISELKPGEQILGANPASVGNPAPYNLEEILQHDRQSYALWQLEISPVTRLTASLTIQAAPIQRIEATPNHPFLTQDGMKRLDEILTTDTLYVYDQVQESTVPYVVLKVSPNHRQVEKVYNIRLGAMLYLVNGVWVYTK